VRVINFRIIIIIIIIVNICGQLLYAIHTQSNDQDRVWRARLPTVCTLTCQISPGSVYCVAGEGEKPRILPLFQLQLSVVAPRGGKRQS